jgi:uncharacterized protein (TIGR00369 family)
MSEPMTAAQLVEMVTSRPGYTSSVGTRVLFAEPGRVHLALDRRPDLLQFSGVFHGGVIAGLADHAAGGAVTTALPTGRIAVTVDLHISFLSPADGQSIIAKAKAIQVGRTVSLANVEVMNQGNGEERLCAFCTVTLRTVDMPSKGAR